jgi:DNA ligase-1
MSMLLKTLVDVSEKIGQTSSKKEKVALIAELLRRCRGRETALAASYLAGRLPQGRLGVGWKMLQQALADLSPAPLGLGLLEFSDRLDGIVAEKGVGSTDRKTRSLREMLASADEKERIFVIRLISGEIRQGALDGLVMEAIAKAASAAPGLVREAFMFSGEIGEVAAAALEAGTEGLARFGPRLFHPIAPMLASPAGGKEEALARLGQAAWEFKLDGARIQLHKQGNEIRIFTRHLKEVTESLPEIVTLARRWPMQSAIFEGEALALKPDGKPHPFQTTMRRFGRVQNVEAMRSEIPLTPFFFDLLYLEGQSLCGKPYLERFNLLAQNISPASLIERIISADDNEVKAFLQKSIQAGHEGIMAKGLDSPYQAGQRGFHWLKIKPAHTLDLVVLAAEWGHGRRKGWLSNLHLGARDPESAGFVMLGKTFKGLTDAMLQWQTGRLLQLETSRDRYTVYVKPEVVVEIAFSDLQQSPRYPGGLALRFARVKRFREDKTAADADTIQTVWRIFEAGRSLIALTPGDGRCVP